MNAKRILILALALAAALSIVPFTANAATGTAISGAAELVNLMNDSTKWDGDYYLSADIDLSSMTNQAPIGNETTKFTGTFDGNGKTISGLNISGMLYQGLFGYAKDATIKNLTVKGRVEEISTSGTFVYAGGVVAALTGSSTLENIKSYVDVSAIQYPNGQPVGGLVGKAGCTSHRPFQSRYH